MNDHHPDTAPLFGFQWHLTDRCNLRCAHCYQEAFDGRREPGFEALLEMARRVFGALAPRPVSVNLTGGEPLLLPGFFDLVEFLHGFPNLAEAHIITNGTVADDDTLARIAAFPRIGALKISLEAADAPANDAVRGRGNFDRVAANLARFRRTGKSLVLMLTLARYNVGRIAEAVRWARGAGLHGIIFERFVPLGRGRRLTAEVLTAADWRGAVAAIAAAAGLDAEPEDLLPFRAFWLGLAPDEEEPLRGALCNLGDESMALMPDGDVYPCRRLPIPVGNVLAEPFADILLRLARFSMDALRPRLSGLRCGYCGVADCAGCRALAYALTGDHLADDPQCPLAEADD
jgi:radical SAM protein with 4Fe4S-binding SPASM domain